MISLWLKTTTKRKRWLQEKCGVELHNADMSLWLIAFVQREAEFNFLLLLCWMYCDEQTQQCDGLTDRRQLRWRGSRGGLIWLDRCPKLCSRGMTPLPHRRKSSENVPLPGSHRWAIRWGREGDTPLLPGRLLLSALCAPVNQLPASSAKLRHPAVRHSSPQTSHAHAAWHLEAWKLPHSDNLCIHTSIAAGVSMCAGRILQETERDAGNKRERASGHRWSVLASEGCRDRNDASWCLNCPSKPLQSFIKLISTR